MAQTIHPSATTAPLGTHSMRTARPHPARDTQPKILREAPTGKEFLEKLRDGRVIYFDGKLVKDTKAPFPPLPPAPARMPACMTRYMIQPNKMY